MRSVPGPVARATVAEQVRLDRMLEPDHKQPGCMRWVGPGSIYFRGRRWVPRRLLFCLATQEGAAIAEAHAWMRSTCGTRECVAPEHQRCQAKVPPSGKLTKKRPRDQADDDDGPDAGLVAAAAEQQQILLALLRHITQASGTTQEAADLLKHLTPGPDVDGKAARAAAQIIQTLGGNPTVQEACQYFLFGRRKAEVITAEDGTVKIIRSDR